MKLDKLFIALTVAGLATTLAPVSAHAGRTRSIEFNPKDAIAYNNRGYAKSDKGDLDGAIADYDEATKFDPKYAIAYCNRGNAKDDKGDPDGAIADYTRAIELNPKYPEAYSARGN